ncbi:RNA-binding domain-containing protein [Acaromyces ingoldii]|uniref:RNA-binding domain-containing protein n=1 Tax=Acaromyces ingoldii TaxID=215250 RepID=A0A316YS42_9BASI|nr:RNA-binding domain-containing protein [Acaromyces ingoldii]PWN92380.1 RNA-binding domain-containing protein [Acaromyces ingoldii]
MSGLLNRSLDDIARQEKRAGGRGSPYARPAYGRNPSSDGPWKHDRFEGGGAGRAEADIPSPKLLVDGLHWDVSEEELTELFSRIGQLERCSLRFDKSGRSEGKAVVIYRSQADAETAKREYHNANAKGQPISVSFAPYRPPRGSEGRGAPASRGSRAPAPGGDLASRLSGSLASRLGPGDLKSRIGGPLPGARHAGPPSNAPRGPAAGAPSRPGPTRSISGGGGRGRGGRGGSRGGGGRGGGRKPDRRGENDLDAELEAFMKAPSSSELAESIHAPQKDAAGDVQME